MGKIPWTPEVFYKIVDYTMNEVHEKLNVHGNCKILSVGPEKCQCAKCQVERMSHLEIGDKVMKKLVFSG